VYRREWVWLLALGQLGCGQDPRAPSLDNEPVYQNNSEGLRFLVPDGWAQYARGNPPSGRAQQEQMLVEYQLLTAEKPASFRVTFIDLPASTPLEAYLAENPTGDRLKEMSPEPFEVDGIGGTRVAFSRHGGAEETTREVFAFCRGRRTYLFTGVFPATDAKARQQILRAVESLRWKR
jgi:hypothetical protein